MADDVDIAPTVDLQCKTCNKCGETKPLSDFNKDSKAKTGLSYRCRDCSKARSRQWSKENNEVARERSRIWYADNPEKGKARARMQRLKNPEKTKAYLAQRYIDNREKVIAYRESLPEPVKEKNRARSKKWASANPDKVRERSAIRRLDQKFRVENSMRIAISSCIRRGSKKSPTFSTLGYTPDDLRSHLEARFIDGMSWGNYGRGGWHIDHIIPLASFSFTTMYCEDFKSAFSLGNLQPLWESENCSKGARLDHPSQLALLADNDN